MIDGVPFGKPFVRRDGVERPPVSIPPLKRRKLNFEGWEQPVQAEPDRGDEYDEDDDDEEYEPSQSEEESDVSNENEENEEPLLLGEGFQEHPDRDVHVPATGSQSEAQSPEARGVKTNARKPAGRRHVSFKETPAEVVQDRESGSVSHDEKTNQQESPKNKTSSSYSSSETDSSESESETSSDAISNPASSSDSDTSSSTSSSSNSEDETITERKKQQQLASKHQPKPVPTVIHAPGQGSTRTKYANERTRMRRKLARLKSQGLLDSKANFHDLRAWEEANPHGQTRSVHVSTVAQGDLDDVAREMREEAEFEKKRSQLLQAIADGGVDITEFNGKGSHRAIKSRDIQFMPPGPSRMALDGDSESTGKPGESCTAFSEVEAANSESESTSESDSESDKAPESFEPENWRKKLIIDAKECVADNVVLKPPPFPFIQRWDEEACAKIAQHTDNGGKKKRKRKSQSTFEYSDYPANGELDYGNDLASVPAAAATNGHTLDKDRDLPILPSDPSILSPVTPHCMRPGIVLAFRQLDMSKATNWQPVVSPFRTATIETVSADLELVLRLAMRDRETAMDRARPVDENGLPVYQGLEMPGDDEGDGEDDGVREISWHSLIDPRLVRA